MKEEECNEELNKSPLIKIFDGPSFKRMMRRARKRPNKITHSCSWFSPGAVGQEREKQQLVVPCWHSLVLLFFFSTSPLSLYLFLSCRQARACSVSLTHAPSTSGTDSHTHKCTHAHTLTRMPIETSARASSPKPASKEKWNGSCSPIWRPTSTSSSFADNQERKRGKNNQAISLSKNFFFLPINLLLIANRGTRHPPSLIE